jgi:small subunit ribosomal protein S4
MGRNIDNKCKQCRRIGEKLFLKGDRCSTPKCAMIKRNYAPGFHGPKGHKRLSDYGLQLQEKQKVHILNILRTNEIEFTKNSNGYFFNFMSLNDQIIEKICTCLDLIESNTDLVREMDRRRNELLVYYKKF